MRFIYPSRLERTGPGEVVVSFRDLPECLTSGADEAEALREARDALEEAIAGRIDDGEPIPVPSAPIEDEQPVAVPADMAAKAAFTLAFRESGLSRVELARRLGVDEKVVRRMLAPHHGTAASRLNEALGALGRELIVEVRELAAVGER
ncbi:MAG: type II toxin-antitoxin system HicB family antitoxin [Chloroflexi bacterium]|nr:type II toxin-antitoxin system HicB family antitoxin [Chloroflexota bacterium]